MEKTAEWIRKNKWQYQCSNCGNVIEIKHTNIPELSKKNYCCDCGRKMK